MQRNSFRALKVRKIRNLHDGNGYHVQQVREEKKKLRPIAHQVVRFPKPATSSTSFSFSFQVRGCLSSNIYKNILTALQKKDGLFSSLWLVSVSNRCPPLGASLRPQTVCAAAPPSCVFIDGARLQLTNDIKLRVFSAGPRTGTLVIYQKQENLTGGLYMYSQDSWRSLSVLNKSSKRLFFFFSHSRITFKQLKLCCFFTTSTRFCPSLIISFIQITFTAAEEGGVEDAHLCGFIQRRFLLLFSTRLWW